MCDNPLFFSLIQIAMGRKEDFGRPVSEKEWAELFDAASRQALVGVTYSALEHLPEDQKAPEGLTFQWYGLRSRTVALNSLMDSRAAEATSIFADMGLRSSVLKGQSVARYYPHPEFRSPGDIDIWVDAGRRKLIKELSKKYKIGNAFYKDTNVRFFNDVEVEVHHRPSFSYNPFLNHRIQKFFERTKARQMSNPSGKGFNSPEPRFDAVFSLSHISHHLLVEGVGLRQLMDYHYILMALSPEDRREVAGTIRKMGMGRLMGAVMYLMTKVFAMDEEYLLCSPDAKAGSFMLDEVLQAGNFGKYDPRNAHSAGETRWGRFLRTTRSQLKFIAYFPSEVLWIPIGRLWYFILRLLRRFRDGYGL